MMSPHNCSDSPSIKPTFDWYVWHQNHDIPQCKKALHARAWAMWLLRRPDMDVYDYESWRRSRSTPTEVYFYQFSTGEGYVGITTQTPKARAGTYYGRLKVLVDEGNYTRYTVGKFPDWYEAYHIEQETIRWLHRGGVNLINKQGVK